MARFSRGDAAQTTISTIDASWGKFLEAVVPSLETPTFDAAERAETISQWYKDEFKLADAPASYRGSSQKEASYRATVAQGIGELAGLIAQELEQDKPQHAAIEPLEQLARDSKEHALAFKELANDSNSANEEQTKKNGRIFSSKMPIQANIPFSTVK